MAGERQDAQGLLRGAGAGDVLIVGANLWDEGAGDWFLGGEQRLLRAWARLLKARGFRVLVVSPAAQWRRWDGDGLVWVGVPPLRTSGFRRAVWNWRLHRLLPATAKVLYSYVDTATPRSVPGALILQHGVNWDGTSPKRQARALRQNRDALATCGAVLCTDTNFPNVLAASTRDLASLHAKCHYLPNFAEVHPAGPPPAPPRVPRILYVRRFGSERGTHLLLEAARRLWDEGLDFELEIVGHDPTGLWEARLRDWFGPELARGRCLLHRLGFEEVAQAYVRGTFALVPSCRSEGTSLACLEAMAFGLPVVATWTGGLPDLVQDGLNGLLIAPVAEDLTRAMRRLLLEPGLRAKLSEGALRATERFSEANWKRRAGAILDELGWKP